MLIHVDRSAIDHAAGTGATAKVSRAALEGLLRAHGEGQHLVSIEPEDILRLAPVGARFSEHSLSVIERIDADAPAIAGLRASMRVHLLVGMGDGFAEPSREERCIRVGLHHFERFERAVRSVLLCENLIDTRFYRLLAELYLVTKRRSDLLLAFEPHGGGGDQFALELANVAATGRILLAVADSDRRFPEGPPGQTWLHAKPIAHALPPFQHARELPVRTAENLVPLAVYHGALTDHGRRLAIERLRRIEEWLGHADLKHGIRLFQVEEEMRDREQDHWRRAGAAAGRLHCNRPLGKGQQRACEGDTDRASCSCYVVDSLGADALRAVVTWMEQRRSRRQIAQLFELSEASKLTELCEELVAWGCAANEIAT